MRNQRVCWICGDEIDFGLPYPDPGSFTVDHVEPRFFRPELEYEYENLRAAHNRCNRKRGLGKRPVVLESSEPW